jgi:hypothetical protein
MRICNITLVEITEALARECPSAMKAALGIFLAIMAGGGANAGPDGKEVPRVAFLGFEFINTSLEATARVEVERIRLLDDVRCATGLAAPPAAAIYRASGLVVVPPGEPPPSKYG